VRAVLAQRVFNGCTPHNMISSRIRVLALRSTAPCVFSESNFSWPPRDDDGSAAADSNGISLSIPINYVRYAPSSDHPHSTTIMYTPKLALFALALLVATAAANPLERRCGEQGAACGSNAACCTNYLCANGASSSFKVDARVAADEGTGACQHKR
jgi:hypothetical protein